MNHKFIFISIFSILITSCKNDEKPPQGPKTVTAVEVESRNVTGYTTYPTTIQGRVNNEVRAKIQGYIDGVLVDEGQYVSQGQPLFKIETNSLTESASAAKAGVGAAQSNVSVAISAVQAAQVEVDKLKPLVEKNIISTVQLKTAQANLSRAQAQLTQAQAGVSQAQANYKSVQENINYSIVRAPISGIVGKINFRKGSLVGPNDPAPITTVSDTKELFAYFSMNEKEYLNFLEESKGATLQEKIKNMPLVEFIMANGKVYSEKGKVEAVTGQIDPTSGSIQFRVSLPNPNKLLSNGNSGSIRVPKYYENVFVLPESATYEQQGLVYIYKVNQDTAKNFVINVVDRVDNMVLIGDGVKKGETVVAEGVGTLKSGTAVKTEMKKLDELTTAIKPIF